MAANPQPQAKKRTTNLSAWKALAAHYKTISKLHLRQLFADDPKRGQRMAIEAVGLYLDYSKNRVTDETLNLLLQLAKESGLRERIDAMFSGEKINITEKRAVLHVALRAPKDESIIVDGKNVVPEVHAVLDRMADFSERVRSGEWKGHTGKRIRNVINIGIGGSDLGPVMAYEALKHYSQRDMTFRFVSNVDGTDFAEAVQGLGGVKVDDGLSKVVPVHVGDEAERHVAVAVMAQGFVGHYRPEVGASNADVDHVFDAFAGMAFPFAAADAVGEIAHLVEDGVHFGNHVFAVDVDLGIPRSTKGGVQNGAIFCDVDFFAAEHGHDALPQRGLLGELKQQAQRLVGDAIFGVIEE